MIKFCCNTILPSNLSLYHFYKLSNIYTYFIGSFISYYHVCFRENFYEGHYYGREERPNTELALYVEPYFHMNLDFHGKVNGERQAK